MLAGGRRDRSLVVALKPAVSAAFRFVGLVATPKVMTFTVDAGVVVPKVIVSAPFQNCHVATPKATTLAVDGGRRDAKTSSFGTTLIRK